MRGELSQWLELVSRPVPGTRQTSQLSLPQIAVPASKLKVAAGMIAKPADVAGDKVNEQGSSGGNGSGGGIGGVFTKRSSGAMDLLVPVTNFQNKRLALMALHAVRDLKTSDFGSVYRAALSDYP